MLRYWNTQISMKTWLQQSGGNEVFEGQRSTLKDVSIHTNSVTEVAVELVFKTSITFTTIIKVDLLPCPPGFTLRSSAGSCDCSHILDQLPGIECSIDEQKFTRSTDTNAWIGIVGSALSISRVCPSAYCNTDPYYRHMKILNGTVKLIKDGKINGSNVSFCIGIRKGQLCGQCIMDYSVVFGGTECRQCSNWWLLTILIYLAIGPLLICLLYALELTLTAGTLNGIIFYVQVANAGLLEFMVLPYDKNTAVRNLYHACRFVLSFLNTNLGFPLCFFNGMNQLWKTGLTLVFPVYLFLMVVVIIIISRYSTWLSNKTSHCSIQVLVTVVHLSFSKLLLTLIDVFTPATVHTSVNATYFVWYWDGSVKFMSKSHLILAIVTVITVGVFIIPYISLLVVGTQLIKRSRRANFYLRPVYEAIHAPYKEGKQYWFVARLLLLIIIYMVYIAFRTNNYNVLSITVTSLLSSFMVTQAISHPFKSKWLNILDSWLMLNITLVYNMLWNDEASSSIILTIVAVLVLLGLLTFGMIIMYHTLARMKRIRKINIKLTELKAFSSKYTLSFNTQTGEGKQLNNKDDSCYGSCTQYREPLILDSGTMM